MKIDFEVFMEQIKIQRQKYLRDLFISSKNPHLKKLVIKEMRSWDIEDRELLEYSFEDGYPAIIIETLKYCSKLNITLSEQVYRNLIDFKNDTVRATFILHSEKIFPWITAEELEDFLNDRSPRVRKAAIRRLKNFLDLRELYTLVNDPDISVKNEALKLIVEKSDNIKEVVWVYQNSFSQKSTIRKALKKIKALSKEYLLNLLETEKRLEAKSLVIEMLKDFPCYQLKEKLLSYLESTNVEFKSKTIYSLSFSCRNDKEVFDKIHSFLDDESPKIKKETLKALRRMDREKINIDRVLKMVGDPNIEVSKEALKTLSLLGIRDIKGHVKAFLKSQDDILRKTALMAIKRLKLREFEDNLLDFIRIEEKLEIRKNALKCLYSIKSQSLEGILREILVLPKIEFDLKYLAAKIAFKSFPRIVSEL